MATTREIFMPYRRPVRNPGYTATGALIWG
jgi:hypothetical protein